MSHQVALTVCADVLPGRLEDVRRILARIRAADGQSAVLPFARIPQTHFARLLVVETGGTATLVLMLDCDAPAHERLHDVVEASGAGLDELFGCCAGYPAPGDRTPAA